MSKKTLDLAEFFLKKYRIANKSFGGVANLRKTLCIYGTATPTVVTVVT